MRDPGQTNRRHSHAALRPCAVRAADLDQLPQAL